jgi:hypothetical protein
MRLRPLFVLVVLALVAAACGSDGDESSSTETAATAEVTDEASAEATTAPTEAATDSPSPGTTAAPEEPAAEPEAGDGVGGATLTIGEETWTFDQVTICTMTEQEDTTVSFVMLIVEDPWQFVGKVIDPTGERRLEGEGVYDDIDFQNIVDGTQGIWMASGEATGAQYFEIDGLSVTANAPFDDFRTTPIEETIGVLDATCP